MSKNPSNSEQFHYVYKITNWYNGKEYIGKHSTYNLDDGYIGTGKLIKRAIKKYGLEYFTKEILSFHKTAQEAYDMEGLLVNEKYVNDKMTYNIVTGGKGGYFPNGLSEEHKRNISKAHLGGTLSEEHKRNIGLGITGERNGFYGKTHSEETKIKISMANSGHVHSEEHKQKISDALTGENNPFYGKKHSEKSLKKIQEASLNKPKLLCPHCNKLCDCANAARWHFDNCKKKP